MLSEALGIVVGLAVQCLCRRAHDAAKTEVADGGVDRLRHPGRGR